MILLDTNVISEMMKESPSSKVIAWIDQQLVRQLWIATPTIAEISYGINALPEGSGRRLLSEAFHKTMNEAFKHRILLFDEAAAYLYGEIMSHRKSSGCPMSVLDGQIAAIALSQGAAIATRNIRDFVGCSLELINPF